MKISIKRGFLKIGKPAGPGGYLQRLRGMQQKAPEAAQYLRSGEKIINVRQVTMESPEVLSDFRHELARLSGADGETGIGKYGPAKAALPLAGSEKAEGQGLYACRFGRDGLYAAIDLMDFYPMLAESTIKDYASLLGMSENTAREESFGKMFHESRVPEFDPRSKKITKENGWGWPYYGSVDSTPLFAKALCLYALKIDPGILEERYEGRDGQPHRLRDALSYSLKWLVRKLNSNKEFFLEYRPAYKGSIENQVMEDSYDSHFYEDGSLPDFSKGVNSTETQGLAYDALVMGAYCYDKFELGAAAESDYFRFLAGELKNNVVKHLWIEDGGYFAAGSGRDEAGAVRAMRVKKAIPFFLLNSLMFLDPEDSDRKLVAKASKTLFSPEFLAAGGIRSLATGEPRYMPGSYHNGSVWLFQTFQIAEGLRLHGYADLAEDLYSRVGSAVETLKYYPEYVRGDDGTEIRVNDRIIDTYDSLDKRKNRREQPPQQVQLWTLTAYAAIKLRQTASEPVAGVIENELVGKSNPSNGFSGIMREV